MAGIEHPEHFPHGPLAPQGDRQCASCHQGQCENCSGQVSSDPDSGACPCISFLQRNNDVLGLKITPEGGLVWRRLAEEDAG